MKTAVVMGKGKAAIHAARFFLTEGRWNLMAVVPVMPEPEWAESLADWARKHQIPVIESGNYADIPESWHIDLAFSIYYDKILPADFINRCGLCLNLHNAPLPKYRGVRPINWALKNRERHHGVTIHQITPEIDAGPIYGQRIFSMQPENQEVRDVYERCLIEGMALFDILMGADRYLHISPRPQDESQATYYSGLDMGKLGNRLSWTRGESTTWPLSQFPAHR